MEQSGAKDIDLFYGYSALHGQFYQNSVVEFLQKMFILPLLLELLLMIYPVTFEYLLPEDKFTRLFIGGRGTGIIYAELYLLLTPPVKLKKITLQCLKH
ncbi:MAG: hypothetical protein RRY34_01985 [Victivallaceae bacterium]